MFAVRMLVTLAILVPYYVVRQPHETVEIFIIAVIAFGTGRAVEALVVSRKKAKSSTHNV